ncbi:DUF4145 domain-containing protein [Pseudomonas asgharzadehiana]|uniref:DUF4145 domain-containing protein n=1 Tax=Pseudomonas asgharzadehiana TaxID=2842349 RepID=A0ABX8NW90_9PSED|nr:DUF4145 domain-containing protein [Pseudomonas asgharzadehiana]QXH65834.1 DUF4145 domain-containing protein [Pseudomonas asgharzadehiana]
MRYFDCTKFDYKNADKDDVARLVERDKSAYKYSFRAWIENEIDSITERKWQIDNIGIVEEAGDFIRLIKEAELTYSLGAFYSTISLAGIASEDLCKYFANLNNQKDLLEITQFKRLEKLKERGVITPQSHDDFDAIRKIRNDCLHFNDDFKSRNRNELNAEALVCLNKLKSIYKALFSVLNTKYKKGELISKIIEDFARQQVYRTSFGDTLNQEEFTMKLRYFMAEELDIDVAIAGSGQKITQVDIFRIDEIDLQITPNEMTITHTNSGLPFIVDLTSKDVSQLFEMELSEGEKIFASIYSILNHQGMTATWYFEGFLRIDE